MFTLTGTLVKGSRFQRGQEFIRYIGFEVDACPCLNAAMNDGLAHGALPGFVPEDHQLLTPRFPLNVTIFLEGRQFNHRTNGPDFTEKAFPAEWLNPNLVGEKLQLTLDTSYVVACIGNERSEFAHQCTSYLAFDCTRETADNLHMFRWMLGLPDVSGTAMHLSVYGLTNPDGDHRAHRRKWLPGNGGDKLYALEPMQQPY